MDYRSVIESKYNRSNWQGLLHDIFQQKVKFWQQPQPISVDEGMAKSALHTGMVNLPDGHSIAIYEVELSDKVIIERNRAGIRNLLCSDWKGRGCAGAFMFCYRQNESVLRFSYVSETFSFTEDGSLKKESTDTKRFTYLLGEGHRSRTAIEQFEKLKQSKLDLYAVTKAFSVEALSDMFFKEYKKQYEDIIEYITGKRMVKVANKWEEKVTGQPCTKIMEQFSSFPDAEKAVRDYVKKLMGRLVFIQFLQKKGWMGCPAGEAWINGDKEFVQNLFASTSHKDTFVDDVLEPLFKDLNTKREGDLASPEVGTGIKIPYLNGGLFERDNYDTTEFPLPAKNIEDILNFFASYNFTIDENDPDDAEIGVDPEMLGRIFENLLEDNKDKGAFYTPKEIVQYMCRESLTTYLQTDISDETVKESIRRFVSTHNSSTLPEEIKTSLDQKLKDVKICDPAIGSGAFPMGLLKELYACRKAIEGIDDETAVSIKTHIIQNNIYGVDIEKGAVDIARLRFWLALIVDEKNPKALPNLDFKIMQGNSLFENYRGSDLSNILVTDKRRKKDSSQYLISFDNEKEIQENLSLAIKKYYSCLDPEKKAKLRMYISSEVKNYIHIVNPNQVQEIDNLDVSANEEFFLWHTFFAEVFKHGGFDIVIGNPPYMRIQGLRKTNSKFADNLVKNFKSATGSFDLYVTFVEKGHSLLTANGTLNYIMPVKWTNSSFGEGLRQYLIDNQFLPKIINFGAYQVFEASTYTGIQMFSHSKNVEYIELEKDLRDTTLSSYLKSISPKDYVTYSPTGDTPWTLANNKISCILNKIKRNPLTLGDVFDKIFQGLATSKDDVYFLYDCIVNENTIVEGYSKYLKCRISIERELVKPLLKGEDVHKYEHIVSNRFVIFPYKIHEGNACLYTESELAQKFPCGYSYLKQCETALRGREKGRLNEDDFWYKYIYPKNLTLFESQKLVAPEISLGGNYSIDYNGQYYSTTTIYGYIKKPNVTISNETLMAILNSQLCWWFLVHTGTVLANGYYRYKPAYLKPFPIPNITPEMDYIMCDLVYQAQQSPNNPSIINRIDETIYSWYNLTEEEISEIISS